MNIQNDTKQMLKECGWTQQRLAKAAGVHFVSLSRFLKREYPYTLAEKIVPFVYGDQRPKPRELEDTRSAKPEPDQM